MIETLWVTNPDGDTLELNLRSSETDHGLLVFNMSGLGPPKATVSGNTGPGYDGIRASFVRTDARHIILTLAVSAVGDAEEVAKQLIYDFFPIKETIILGVTTGTKDVFTEAIVETNEFNQFAKVENAVIGLFCPDPYWIDLLPQEVPLRLNTETLITYGGDVPVGIYMTIIFGGSTPTLYITNDNGGQIFYVNLSVIGNAQAGEKIHIDTRVGQKSVIHETVLGVTTSLLPAIGMGDDWIQLNRGDNNIEVATTVTPHSDIPTGLVAFWSLSEINAPGALDLHADKHLTHTGVIGKDTGLRYPYARDFPGSSGVRFQNSTPDADLAPVGDFAISFWAKVDTYPTSGYGYILETLEEPGDGYFLRVREYSATNELQFAIHNGVGELIRNLEAAATGVWAIYFIWYDASAKIFYMQMNDGTPITKTLVDPPSAYSAQTFMGGLPSGDEFDGQLQSVAFYDSVLTVDNMTFLRNNDNGRTYAETVGEIEVKIHFSPEFQGV